ncbi:MAG: GNAT family N-acetyltransferase [bacterium]|nr:GNAT family N-acetyltransferase [bacterium]
MSPEHYVAATPALRLRRFVHNHAATVAEWVTTDQELFWTAPSIEPPLTARKVLAWAQSRGVPCLLCEGESDDPIGYAELNVMRNCPDQLWIGHVILDPVWRGCGHGVSFMRLLLDHAFDALGAQRVSLIVFPDNHQAIRCYVAAGMMIQGEQFHKYGRPLSSHRMLHLTAAAK